MIPNVWKVGVYMSMMRLYIDKPLQPADNEVAIYPIYELDLQGLADAGMVSWVLSGQVTNAVNECYHVSGSVNNATVNQYLSTNIPHQQWQDGSILQARISKYVLNENNVYVPDPDYYEFEDIPIGQQPDDWGTASNYLRYVVSSNATIDGQTVTYRAYFNVRKVANWNSERQYVRDKNRSIIRHFYTENGYSFGVYQGADCDGVSGSSLGPVFNVAGDSQYSDNLSNPSSSYYTWCNPSGNGLYVGGNNVRVLSPWWSRTDTAADKGKMIAGREVRAATFFIFVHGVYNGKDYYGTLCIYPQDFSETATFKQIAFSLFTAEFWGKSITTGGNDGKWGDVSVSGGGDGTFDFDTTYNRNPDLPSLVKTERELALISLLGEAYRLWKLDGTDFHLVLSKIFTQTFMNLYQNSYINPASGIINLSLMPESLTGDEYGEKSEMTISGYNISDALSDHLFQGISPVGYLAFDAVPIEKVFDAFPDFSPYTQAVLHLPYIGDLELDVNYIAHGVLKVTYFCDMFSGNVTAWVWTKDKDEHTSFKYNATGNCAYNIPILSTFFDGSSVGKLRDSLAYTASNVFMSETPYFATQRNANIRGAVQGMFGAASDIAGIITAPRGSVVRGSFGGNASLYADTDCYLELTLPAWVQPANYNELNGIPSELSGTLADDGSNDHVIYNGYTVVSEIHLENVDCTENEKVMIEAALKRGVHIYSERY